MGSGDFLQKDATTPLYERFIAAGARCSLSTNFEPILEAARESFFPVDDPDPRRDFCLRLWVDKAAQTKPPWPKPHFRGLGHLVFAGFDSQNSLVIDLRNLRAIGRFSPAMGVDGFYWKTVIFPVLISIMGASVGVTELHCACVASHQDGLLLAGRSASGKSTLALALTQNGFAFLSDDRTYISRSEGQTLAWGLPTLLKLRPDALHWFRGFAPFTGQPPWYKNRALWIDPARQFGLERALRCEPRGLVFLERAECEEFNLTEIPRDEACARLAEDLMAETPQAAHEQIQMITCLSELPCWLLRYGGPPLSVARELSRQFQARL